MQRYIGRAVAGTLLFAAAGILGAAILSAQAGAHHDVDPALTKADVEFVAALAKGDGAALDKFLDKDLRWVDFRGHEQTTAQVLRGHPKALIGAGTADSDEALANSHSEETAHVYGTVADVQENHGRAHVLRVWVKRTGGWKLIAYQEVLSLAAPPTTTPGPGKVCVNPCENTPFKPTTKNDAEVIAAYSKLETGAFARKSRVFATMVADEFVAASSNSNKLYDKRGRIEDFDHSKTGGVAPTPLTSAKMYDFGSAVLMLSDHTPDHGKALRVTRLWVKESGHWTARFSYQTTID